MYTLEGVSSVANFITAYEESQWSRDSHFLICSVFFVSGAVFLTFICFISRFFQNSEIPLVSFKTMAMFHTYSFQNTQIIKYLLSAFEIQLCSVSSHLKHSVAFCFKLRLYPSVFVWNFLQHSYTYIHSNSAFHERNLNKLAVSNSVSAMFIAVCTALWVPSFISANYLCRFT